MERPHQCAKRSGISVMILGVRIVAINTYVFLLSLVKCQRAEECKWTLVFRAVFVLSYTCTYGHLSLFICSYWHFILLQSVSGELSLNFSLWVSLDNPPVHTIVLPTGKQEWMQKLLRDLPLAFTHQSLNYSHLIFRSLSRQISRGLGSLDSPSFLEYNVEQLLQGNHVHVGLPTWYLSVWRLGQSR